MIIIFITLTQFMTYFICNFLAILNVKCNGNKDYHFMEPTY